MRGINGLERIKRMLASFRPAAPPPRRLFGLPRVSVIITAYNYAHFLDAAVASVKAQTYAEVECIVVNDGSTDDTAARLRGIQAAHPDVVIVTLAQNAGQGAASRAGLRASRGQYIVFMDADDELAPDFIATHIYVHLSARFHAGLSSSDIWQVQEERIVAATGEALNNFIRMNPPAGIGAFRPFAQDAAASWPYARPGAELLENVRHVPPGRADWVFSPMTGNMFRREILLLIADCDIFEHLRIGTDVYLCTGVSLLCGSFLIDRPLSLYRIHGNNQGSTQVQLDNMRTVKPEAELSASAKALLLRHFLAQRAALSAHFWHDEPLARAIAILQAACGGDEGAGNVEAA